MSDTDGMEGSANELGGLANIGSSGYSQELAQLAEQVRTTVTPVVGYLELTSQTTVTGPTSQDLAWISTIERRLGAMHELHGRIVRVCEDLRQAIDEQDRATASAR